MEILEFLVFLAAGSLRTLGGGWMVGKLFFGEIEIGLGTIIRLLLLACFGELIIRSIENYARYRVVLIQHALRKAAKEAELRAREEARRQQLQAQHQASEKYFDSRDFVLGGGAKRTPAP